MPKQYKNSHAIKHLLIFTQKVDETDDLLGFFVAWIREFSKYFEHVDVVTLAAGAYTLPEHVHVHSLGKEYGASKMVQAFRCLYFLWKCTPNGGGVFCHMSPIFAILAWPFARLRKSKLTLWYLHRSKTIRLRVALALCDHLITADAVSLTIKNVKIRSVGHGIDVERFSVPERIFDENRPLRLLSVGRLAPIKDFSTFIHALKDLHDLNKSIEARIIGRAITPEHKAEEQHLRALVREMHLEGFVRFTGFVPYPHMPEQYRWADIVIGCTPHGGLDKALLEAMAAGCIVVTSNSAMRATLGQDAESLLFAHGNWHELSHAIQMILPSFATVSKRMIEQVRMLHSMKATIEKISMIMQ